MKTFVIFAVFLILFVNLSQQLSQLVNCEDDYEIPASVRNGCGVYTCDGPDRISGVGCAMYRCETQIGYTEQDDSLPYPDCCARPICA